MSVPARPPVRTAVWVSPPRDDPAGEDLGGARFHVLAGDGCFTARRQGGQGGRQGDQRRYDNRSIHKVTSSYRLDCELTIDYNATSSYHATSSRTGKGLAACRKQLDSLALASWGSPWRKTCSKPGTG